MKTIVEHPLYGRMSYDTATNRVSVQHDSIAKQLNYLMRNQDELGSGYYPDSFVRACELLGIVGGELDVKITTEGEVEPPPRAVY
jgi:hypothetical protein